jgi:predicted dehydrogenase
MQVPATEDLTPISVGFVGSEQDWVIIQGAFGPQSAGRLVATVIETDQQTNREHGVEQAAAIAPRSLRSFDELASDPQIHAVILGGSQTDRAGRIKQLTLVGRHCLCLQPVELNPLYYHEVAMAAQDNGTTIMPWLPAKLHPLCRSMIEQCLPRLGSLKLITIERSGTFPTGRQLFGTTYAEACDVLWMIAGDTTELFSTGDVDLGRLVVHHRMSSGATGEIRIGRSEGDRWMIVVQGDHGVAELACHNGIAGPAVLKHTSPNESGTVECPDPSLADRMLNQFAAAVHGRPHSIGWSDAIRCMELADWAWYSLQRRRAVDIFREERGELASFKGRMTSIGCGLIWTTLLVLIVIAAGTGLEVPGMNYLAVAMVVIWVLFLLFQALRWAIPPNNRLDHKS